MDLKRFPRVRSALSIEGFGLMVILGFVAVCSILRSVNLLVVISGMIMFTLILCWRVSRRSIRHLIVSRIVLNRAHANSIFNIQWEIINNNAINLLGVRIIDSVVQLVSRNGRIKPSRGRRTANTEGIVSFAQIPAVSNSFSSFQIRFAERGIYTLGPARIETRYPLGLITSWFHSAEVVEVHVAPQLGDLAVNWSSRLTRTAQGASLKSGRTGTIEEDFYAIREWRSGDNKRKIHWRSSAKFGQPMVKEFDRTTQQNLAIVLDLAADSQQLDSASEFNLALADCERILSFAATVVSGWANQNFGQLCIGLAGQDIQIANSNTENQFVSKSMRILATAQSNSGDQLEQTLSAVLGQLTGNAVCLVVSSRSRSRAENHVDAKLLDSVYWIESQSPAFQSVFKMPEHDYSISPEYLPSEKGA